MPIRFTKMHGLGNDYVYVSLFEQSLREPAEFARQVSDRHRGVGSDGLILVGPPRDSSADVRMEMYNADGSRAQMCGNGIRCVGKLAYERGWARVNPLRVATDAGVLTLELTLDANGHVALVRVDMGAPILDAARIPVRLSAERVVDVPAPPPAAGLRMTCVSLGNPHCVIFCDELARIPLRQWGPLLERHELFPERVNVHFVQVLTPMHARMATWERGAGPTQACGTGAAAVCVAGLLTGRSERRMTATLPGGDLLLEWDAQTDHVFKTGPAVEVFSGEWPGHH